LQALVSLYGIIPTGVKTDAFTCAGINSRHPSRIDTLVLRPKDVEGGLAKIQVSSCSLLWLGLKQ
jgi:hypothetical protein